MHVSHRTWGESALAAPATSRKRLGISIGYLDRPQLGEDHSAEQWINILSNNLAVTLVRLGGNPRLYVLQPPREKLRHRDLGRFDIEATV
jgi:hypothetical protein